ncbi:MAG: serine hydrolase [Candidatus Marinimicrobia bacterium]|nr:serine hydrolase [Candidatus Neomarinimicrobiota bacterium]
MCNNSRLLIFIIIFLISTISSTCSTKSNSAIKREVEQYLSSYTNMDLFSGSVLVARDGEIIINKGYGMSNYEYDIPNGSHTKFRIASITKTFTAMAIMMLEKQNRLSTNDYLSEYLPDYPNGDIIKIMHLLTHSSGIPDHTKLSSFYRERRVYQTDIINIINEFKDMPLEFSPGKKFSYSNSGYILLGYIIEKVTGESYEDYLVQNILKPLKMDNTGFEYKGEIIDSLAYGYELNNNKLVKADYRIMSNAHASGALYSTIEDLYLWDRVLYSENLIAKSALDRMFTPYNDNYGIGWGIVDLFNRKMVGHNGEIEGFRTNISRFINDNVCIIILSNNGATSIGKISIDLAAIVFDEEYPIPGQKQIVKIAPNILDDYVGKYELKPHFFLTITSNENRLYCQPTGQDKLEIHPESETDFFLTEADVRISFIRDKNDRVVKLLFKQGENEIYAKKIFK